MTAPYQSSLVTHSYSLWDSSFGSLRFDLALLKILLWAKKSGTSSYQSICQVQLAIRGLKACQCSFFSFFKGEESCKSKFLDFANF